MSPYYLYRHIRLDVNPPIPFYIGISSKKDGKTTKSQYPRAFSLSRNKAWLDVYKGADKNISVEILYETDSVDEIVKKEIEFIALYGRKEKGGLLVNLTDGGIGKTGSITPPHVKEKLSKALIGIKRGPMQESTKIKLGIALKGKFPTDETRKKLSAKLVERHKKKPLRHSDETKRKIGLKSLGNKNNLGRVWTEEQKDKLRAWKPNEEQLAKMKGRKLSDSHKKKISEWAKGRIPWNKGIPLDDIHRKNLSESLKGKTPWNKGGSKPIA